MPRSARKKSESNIYHIMLRGINQQQIFCDNEDYQRFLWCLWECKRIGGFELYAYCLMGNHVHLLIKECKEPLDLTFKRLGSKFVYWYNAKYGRVGHLFQDRYKSEPVETDAYFLTVLRYIHQNPVKAGLCTHAEDYQWSSYSEYFKNKWIIDPEFLLSMIPIDEYIRYHNIENNDSCLENSVDIRRKVVDEQIVALMNSISNCSNPTEFQMLSEYKQISHIHTLHKNGASIRQICRLTGCSKNKVERWLKA